MATRNLTRKLSSRSRKPFAARGRGKGSTRQSGRLTSEALSWNTSWRNANRVVPEEEEEERCLEAEVVESSAVSAVDEHWQFDPLGLGERSKFGDWQEYDKFLHSLESRKVSAKASSSSGGSSSNNDFSTNFFNSQLPNKILQLLLLIAISRVGVYIPLPGVDAKAFGESLQQGGLLSYIDTLSGGSISKVGVFSLGIVPYINASIVFQLLTTTFPQLKAMQREDGQYGRNRFKRYQKLAAIGFALVQGFGQCLYIRPYVDDFSFTWLATSVLTLTAGAASLIAISDEIDELKLGNGTSLLIFVNIASSVPASVGQLIAQASSKGGSAFDSSSLVFLFSFILTCAGIVYVQEAERKIPINYSQGGRIASASKSLTKSSYLPFKVNAAGVMPVIFSSSLLAVPSTLLRFTNLEGLSGVAQALGPGGKLYLPLSVILIALFNYFYTFLQLEPDDLAQQLKRQGASIPSIRPGKSTSEYISQSLERMSVLGSLFLGGLALTPALVEALTDVTALRGFAGTSLLILVGVATDSARRFKAEMQMAEYKVDDLYKDMDVRKL
jgi:preprotein translocase SecY subunit